MKNAARAAAAMLALSFTFTILAGCAKTPSDSSFPDSSVSDEIPDADSSGGTSSSDSDDNSGAPDSSVPDDVTPPPPDDNVPNPEPEPEPVETVNNILNKAILSTLM